MFLRRKFSLDTGPLPPEVAALPERVRDVVANLNLLLATKRGVGHILPNFGFSHSGHSSTEGIITEYIAEIRENVGRYEPRLRVLEIDGQLSNKDRPELVIEACIASIDSVWTLAIDLRSGRVVRVTASS